MTTPNSDSTRADLISARDYLERGYSRYNFAEDSEGNSVNPSGENVSRWGVHGALWRAIADRLGENDSVLTPAEEMAWDAVYGVLAEAIHGILDKLLDVKPGLRKHMRQPTGYLLKLADDADPDAVDELTNGLAANVSELVELIRFLEDKDAQSPEPLVMRYFSFCRDVNRVIAAFDVAIGMLETAQPE